MLVLSRKKGERICVGSDIVVTVVRISGNAIKLGIEAPDGVQILRAELVNSDPQGADPEGEAARSARTARTKPAGEGHSDLGVSESDHDDPIPGDGLSRLDAGGPRVADRVEFRRIRCSVPDCAETSTDATGCVMMACR